MSTPPFSPGPSPRTVRTAAGAVKSVPADWVLLPPGDAGLTRRVKAAGDHFVVQEKVGRRMFSRGVWAPAATVARIEKDVADLMEPFAPWERVKIIRVLRAQFTIDAGELTPTLKLKRKPITERYAAEIEAMYAE